MTSMIDRLLSFLKASPSPFHAVDNVLRELSAVGYLRLRESDPKWTIRRGGKYVLTRNGSSLIAFVVGERFNPDKDSFSIIGTHTDSCCLRIKPISRKKPRDGFLQVEVEPYGGGLWHTWFDRDL